MKTAKDIRVKGYKLPFQLSLPMTGLEELLNDFLREVDSRNIPSLLQMSDKEVGEAALSFFTNNN